MTEIKKFTKIVLLVDAILWFMFGTLITFLYDMTMNPEGWTNPYMPKFFGGILYLSAIIAILMLRKKEWEEIKLTFEYLLGLFIPVLITEIAGLAILGSTFEASMILQNSSTITIVVVLFTIGIFSYIKN